MQVSTCWTEAIASTAALPFIEGLALRHCERGGEVGQEIAHLIKQKRFLDLCKFSINPDDFVSPAEYLGCAQAQAFYKKAEWLDVGIDREKAAYSAFLQSEVKCAEVNQFFRALASGTATCLPDHARLLGRVRGKIRRVLGPVPDLGSLNFSFGPGATVSIRKRDACPRDKLASMPECSTGLFASPYLPALLRELPHWASAHATKYSIDNEGYLVETVALKLTSGRLEFAPKNALTYRTVVIEPSLNGVFQAGIGSHIGRRLRVVAGIDIRDQTRNQRLARQASITGDDATLDLTAASDSEAYELVKALVSDEWFLLLKGARTGSVTYKGTEIRLEKFSSMGNGFTFPLETLIFWAITTSCYDVAADIDRVGIYGDDIVCPVSRVDQVIKALNFFGFSVNKQKSFWKGPFRESCGADYFLGIPVRPFFLKKELSAATLFTMHNFFFREGDSKMCDAIVRVIPKALRLWGPDGYGDGHLLAAKWPRILLGRKLLAKGYSGCKFSTFVLGSRKSLPRYPGDYITPLYSIYRKGIDSSTPALTQPSQGVLFTKSGRPLWPLPGEEGYKRIEIYTFM